MKRTLSILLCIIISAAVLASCDAGERPLTVGELLDLGEKYLLDMNYEQAIVCFTRVIEVEPNNTRAYIGRGIAYTALKQYDEAIQDFKRVIEIDPGIPEAYIRLADVYIAIGETGEAEEILRNGLVALSGNSEIQSMLDALMRGQNDGSSGSTESRGSGRSAGSDPEKQGAGLEETPESDNGETEGTIYEPALNRWQFPDLPAHLTGQIDAIIEAYEARDIEQTINLAIELAKSEINTDGDGQYFFMYKGIVIEILHDFINKGVNIHFTSGTDVIEIDGNPMPRGTSVIGWNCYVHAHHRPMGTEFIDLVGAYRNISMTEVEEYFDNWGEWTQWTIDDKGNGELYSYKYHRFIGMTVKNHYGLNDLQVVVDYGTREAWQPLENYLYNGTGVITGKYYSFYFDSTKEPVRQPVEGPFIIDSFETYLDGYPQPLGPVDENGLVPVAVDGNGHFVNSIPQNELTYPYNQRRIPGLKQ